RAGVERPQPGRGYGRGSGGAPLLRAALAVVRYGPVARGDRRAAHGPPGRRVGRGHRRQGAPGRARRVPPVPHPFLQGDAVMKTRRRTVLKGLGGLTLALPFLEGLRSGGTARAGEVLVEPYAIFLRQANGCGSAQNTEVGSEPERFWPTTEGALTPETMAGRAVDELSEHMQSLLLVGVDAEGFDYGDGHARGALQGLTASGPVVAGAGGSSEANGESIDHRTGRELNADARDSPFLS